MKKANALTLGILLGMSTAISLADEVVLEDKLEMLEGRMWDAINSTDPNSVREFAELLEAIDETKAAIAKRELSPKRRVMVATPKSISLPKATEVPVNLQQETITETPVVLPDAHKLVVVDKKSYTMKVYRDGNVIDTQRVIIGRPGRETPSFKSVITHVVLNPYWNVSPNIATKDLAPMFAANPRKAEELGYEVFDGWQEDSPKLDPRTIDWSKYNDKRRVPYMIRQRPGPHNVLGKIKFIVTSTELNNQGIFLHGTEEPGLFEEKNRKFSSGCVRVENDVHLAKLLLNGDNGLTEEMIQNRIDTGNTKWLKLRKPVEVNID